MEAKVIKKYWRADWNSAFETITPTDLERLISSLTPRAAVIFMQRAMQDPPTQLKELAERFSVSIAHVSKLEGMAARSLLTRAKKEGLIQKL